jgi:hypothetical protein
MADPVALRYHRSLYSPASVAKAAERFAAFGPTVVEAEADVLVTFTTVPDHLRARLGDEFGNHALFQTIVDARC